MLAGISIHPGQIEYDTRTHHSNTDVFDRIRADDMKQAATIMAAFVFPDRDARRKDSAQAGPGKTNQGKSKGIKVKGERFQRLTFFVAYWLGVVSGPLENADAS